MKENKIDIFMLVSSAAILTYFILNITSAVLMWPIFFHTAERITMTYILLLCTALIYIFLKSKIMTKIFLYYWIFNLAVLIAAIIRVRFGLFFLSVILRRIRSLTMYFTAANNLLHCPIKTPNGTFIINDNLFQISIFTLLIILYLIKVSRQK